MDNNLAEQVQATPETGNEVPYEEAVDNMTEGEVENLNDAIANFDWNAYFNDAESLEQGQGPTLTP